MFRVAQAATGNTFRLSDVPEDEVANWLTASGKEGNHPEPWRISVLAAGENDWDNQKATFLGMGGKA